MQNGEPTLVTDTSQISPETKFDVMVPLIGHESQKVEGSVIWDIYEEILKEEEIGIESFRNIGQGFLLRGDWRRLFERPQKMDYRVVSVGHFKQDVTDFEARKDFYLHGDARVSLSQSDLDQSLGNSLIGSKPGSRLLGFTVFFEQELLRHHAYKRVDQKLFGLPKSKRT